MARRARCPSAPAARPRHMSASTQPCSSGRSWDLAAPNAVRPIPGTAKIVSTATAPPVKATMTIPNWGMTAGSARRSTPSAIRPSVTPAERHSATQRSSNAPGRASPTSLPSIAPAGTPMATAGSTRFAGPAHPEVGSHPSHTPTTTSPMVARRNSGHATRIAPTAPPGRRSPSVPRAPRQTVGAHSAAASSSATMSAHAMSVNEVPIPDATAGPTGWPETHEVPRSPRASPAAHRPRSASGPASSPRSARIASSASAVASCSADLARNTVSAGSLRESHGSRPTTASSAARAASRARTVLTATPGASRGPRARVHAGP